MESQTQHSLRGEPSPRRSLGASVDRLEQSAERMSIGSDLGAEIRKIWQDQKHYEAQRQLARNGSASSSGRQFERQRSASSLSNSVEANGNHDLASPGAQVISPSPSAQSSRSDLRQRAYSNPRSNPRSPPTTYHVPPLPYQYSSDSIRDVYYPEMDPHAMRQRGLPPISEASRYRGPNDQLPETDASAFAHSRGSNRRPSQSYRPPKQQGLEVPSRGQSLAKSTSNASQSTMHQARSLWGDFDGVHYTPLAEDQRDGYILDDTQERSSVGEEAKAEQEMHRNQAAAALVGETTGAGNEGNEEGGNKSLNESGLAINFDQADSQQLDLGLKSPSDVGITPAVQHNVRWAEPPPSQDMVYYPAPVPMNLNMPKRLSQLPTQANMTTRRSQVLGSMPLEVRQSALRLSGMPQLGSAVGSGLFDSETNMEEQKQQRQSVLNFQKLPPQLRASVFFDHPPIPHQIQVKNGSAVATLDSLLDASARAPANHSPEDLDLSNIAPIHVHKRGKSGTLSGLAEAKPEANKSRISLLPFKKLSYSMVPQQIRNMAGANDQSEAHGSDSQSEYSTEPEQVGLLGEPTGDLADDQTEHSEAEDDVGVGTEEKPGLPTLEEQYNSAPTTLLAELQLRKQQLRSRNRTAATAFPHGMHATLLELDAVEQIEKKRRKGQRTALAWDPPTVSEPSGANQGDDDVPLGVLYPSQSGAAKQKLTGTDWDRPLGLIEKRHQEDHEPLSKRRNRLMGVDPNAAVQPPLTPAEEEVHSEHEEETLAQRTRRLKSSKALDDALGEGKVDGFTSDVISQFGGLDDAAPDQAQEQATKPVVIESVQEETLGQRRKRLQAQAKAGMSSTIRQVPPEISSHGLVGKSEESRNQRHNDLIMRNQLGSSNMLEMPLIDPRKQQMASSGLLGANQYDQELRKQQLLEKSQPYASARVQGMFGGPQAGPDRSPQPSTKSFMAGRYNDGNGGIQATMNQVANVHANQNVFAQQMVMQQQRSLLANTYNGYPQGTVPYQQSGIPTNGMPMMYTAQGMPMLSLHQQETEAIMMSSKQRENIDRWRQSVME